MSTGNLKAVCTIQMEAEDGRCGFTLRLDSVAADISVRNLTPDEMVKQLRHLAIDLPGHLKTAAANIEAKHAVGHISQVQ